VRVRFLMLSLLILCVAGTCLARAEDRGSATLHPDTAVSATYGTWTVTYTVGALGMAEGAALRVQLPDAMHGGPRNSALWLQSKRPQEPNYVAARTSREGVGLRTTVEMEGDEPLVKHPKSSLDGRFERYVYVVRVEIVQGVLQQGDTVAVIYGDTTGGSAGLRAGDVLMKPTPVLLAVDIQGAGEFAPVAVAPLLRLTPGPAEEMLAHLPSRTAIGATVTLTLSFVDAMANPAPADSGAGHTARWRRIADWGGTAGRALRRV